VAPVSTEAFKSNGEPDFEGIQLDMLERRWGLAADKLTAILARIPAQVQAKELLAEVRQHFCWFCREPKNPGVEDASKKVSLYKERGRLISQTAVVIPRCQRCRKFHALQRWFWILSLFLISSGVCGAAFFLEAGTMIPVIVLAGLGVWFFLNALIMSYMPTHLRVEQEGTGSEYPGVKKLLADGWQVGEKSEPTPGGS